MKGQDRLAGASASSRARETARFDVLSATVACLALALAGLYPGNNPDTFGHLAQGRQIAELGHVPRFDTWSLLPGPPRPWLNYEWLSDLGTYLLYAQFGYAAVTMFKCLLLVVTVVCLVRTAQLLSGPRAVVLTSLAVISTIPAIRVRLSDRPHVLGICLAASYLWLLSLLQTQSADPARRRGNIALVVLLAALHVLWVNSHGSHLLGLAITGSFIVLTTREARRWCAYVLAVQLLASCISPYGPAIWLDAIDHVVDPRYRALVTEWQPWRATDPVWLQLGPVLHGAVLAVLIPVLLRSAPSARAALPIALLLGAACFRSIRFLAEFMLLTSPLIGIGLGSLATNTSPRRFMLAVSTSGLMLALLVPYGANRLFHQPVRAQMSLAGLPSAAGSLLARHGVAPRIFAAMQDSWYLMFAAPQSRFVVDGRVPFYGADYIKRVSRAFADPRDFARLYDELRFNVVVVSHGASGEQQVSAFLEHKPAWSLLLIEDLHATYVTPGTLDAAGTRAYPPLVALEPSYALAWLLDADAERSQTIRQELVRLAKEPGTSGYRSWIEGVLLLAPLRRGAAADGFRWPRSPADWAVYRRATPLINHTAERVPDVPVVSALQAQLAAVSCDFATAEGALERALVEGASREPLLVAQEIALRKGKRDEVRKVVQAARLLPKGQHDPWLSELAAGVEQPPLCPDE